jgi:hypothetical protein
MKKPDSIISIDPDCEKSGVCFLATLDRSVHCQTMSFPLLIDYLKGQKEYADRNGESLLVIVEASWLSENNWHLTPKDSRRMAAAKGNAVGRNHEVGRKIIEMCQHYGMYVLEQRPLRKCWNGPDGKITHEEISQFIPGFPKKSNQEIRDCALIAWNYAGFPIRVKVKCCLD